MLDFRIFFLPLLGICFFACQNENPIPPNPATIPSADTVSLPLKPVPEEPPLLDYDTSQWTELRTGPQRRLDFRYATSNNFLKQAVYPCGRCFLRPAAARALQQVEATLHSQGLRLILYDCYRPRPVQFRMWEILPDKRYVSDPNKGSMHNRGLAVDLGLIDAQGQVLEMGTDFDYFGPEAWHEYQQLDSSILANRQLLKSTMEQYGFQSIRTEWWHYSFQGGSGALDDFVWGCPEIAKNPKK